MGRLSLWVLLGLTLFAVTFNDVSVSAEVGPTETECRPYIEKAINELKTGDASDKDAESGEGPTSTENAAETTSGEDDDEAAASGEADATLETIEITDGDSTEAAKSAEDDTADDDQKSAEDEEDTPSGEQAAEDTKSEEQQDDGKSEEQDDEKKSDEQADDDEVKSEEQADEAKSGEDDATEDDAKSGEEDTDEAAKSDEKDDEKSGEAEQEDAADDGEASTEAEDQTQSGEEEKPESGEADNTESEEKAAEDGTDSQEADEEVATRTKRSVTEDTDSKEDEAAEDGTDSQEEDKADDDDDDDDDKDGDDEDTKDSEETATADDGEDSKEAAAAADDSQEADQDKDGKQSEEEEADAKASEEADDKDSKEEATKDDGDSKEADDGSEEADKADEEDGDSKEVATADADDSEEEKTDGSEEEDTKPEDELLWEGEIPENLRDRKHIDELLHLDDDFEEKERATDRVAEIVLRDVKRIYENAVKPLETIYKYRDLSNRHFSDPEIFSKPLVLFMGPWSGGKSSIINYLTDNEYTPNSLRSGAEPSPAYFNILMWGNETEVLDGNQLAADYTFSGLQKFGQGLEDRLRGLKMPSKLLEKVNIVEIPGILEVRKQVSRQFPFNDACQWFIDRADIIFLVYDPAKLDAGPETEAILDQLKGREYQTRIVLNKADTVHPEELLRVQSALIWNISPLMSSAQPPVMYTTSLWSHPYESGSPVRLLQAQERAFLRDLRTAVDKRIENKIASARRFAVRVRNHAKMVDCYLTTYYNHKTLFGNKKRISDEIVDHPQNYHIYEGLSTLTNISRYDLPDPEVYRDFFRLNPLFEFKKLSETCTYFRGCPINKLDVAIAYDLPELTGKYKKMAETALNKIDAVPAAAAGGAAGGKTNTDSHKSRS